MPCSEPKPSAGSYRNPETTAVYHTLRYPTTTLQFWYNQVKDVTTDGELLYLTDQLARSVVDQRLDWSKVCWDEIIPDLLMAAGAL
jgi:DNA-binding MurR/RpiR family transcriptional regulator